MNAREAMIPFLNCRWTDILRWLSIGPRVHRRGLLYVDARGELCTLPWNIEAKQLRRLLTPLTNEGHEN